MSVQAGLWNLDEQPVDLKFFEDVGESVAEYGPDGGFTHLNGSVGMLYRPFHTTSDSRLERQPYHSAKGHVITWDGRLDNRDELMVQLDTDLGPDHTDVGIVAAALDRWDTDCFSKLIGDWALCFWDCRSRRLVLARDYIGIRHLFYYPTPNRVLWCNHLAPLALVAEPLRLSDDYVAGFLAMYPEAHETPYREIHSVPPGAFVTFGINETQVRTYWTFNAALRTSYQNDTEYEEHFRCLLRQSVRRRLRSDCPILADLSGGFDSSSIVCMADDILAKEGADIPRLDTFSVYDITEPDSDDFDYFNAVEKKRGRVGFHVDLSKFDGTFSLQSPEFCPAPQFMESDGFNTAVRAITEQSGSRVALSGLGGDELLGQALDPRVQFADLLLQFRMRELTRQLTTWSLLIRRPWIQLFLETLRLFLPARVRARMTKHSQVEAWINATFARQKQMARRKLPASERSRSWRPSTEDLHETIAHLARQMTFSQPSRLEKRYPYLDQTLVEFLTSIPNEQLLRPGQRRSLVRRALPDILPPEILSRRTKASAGRGHVATLERHWTAVDTLLRDPLVSRLGFVDRDRFREALWAAKHGHLPADIVTLFRALSLEVWVRDVSARGLFANKLDTAVAMSGSRRERNWRDSRVARTFASKQVDSSTRREVKPHDLQQTGNSRSG